MNTSKRLVAYLLAMITLLTTASSCKRETPSGSTQSDTTQPVTTTPVTTEPIVLETITTPILNKTRILSEVDSFQTYALTDIIGHTDADHTNIDETMTRGEWFEENIPFIETPEALLNQIYYFRWDNLLTNIAKRTSDNKYMITEGGPSGSSSYHSYIDCAQGAHIRDARWIKDTTYLNDYLDITPSEERYWNYLIDAVLEKYYLDGDLEVIERNYEKLKARFHSRDGSFDSEIGLYYLFNVTEGQEAGVNGFEKLERNMIYTASFTSEGSSLDALHDNYTKGEYWSCAGSGNETDYIEVDLNTPDAYGISAVRIKYKSGEQIPVISVSKDNGISWSSCEMKPSSTDMVDMIEYQFRGKRSATKIRIEFTNSPSENQYVEIYELNVVCDAPFGGTTWSNVIAGDESYRIASNSYMAAAADAISKMAALLGKDDDAVKYAEISEGIVNAMLENVWDDSEDFFFELTRLDKTKIVGKESNNYAAWAFGLMPDDESYSAAWKYLMDENVFLAQYGITTLERGNPHYMQFWSHACLWNGPVWPHTFSLILTALSEHLRSDSVTEVDKIDYYDLLIRYCTIHFDGTPEENILAIRECHYPDADSWKALASEYNHSTFIDNVLNGLMGIRPTENSLIIDPIVPDEWEYFCVQDVTWKGKSVTIVYDKTGEKYGVGTGYRIVIDGNVLFFSDTVEAYEIME